MFNLRSILGLIMFVQSGLFAADPLPAFNEHFDDWEALLVQLFDQKSLQPHLVHSGAYPLIRVSRKLHSLMEQHRDMSRKLVWQLPLPNNYITDLPLDTGIIVKKGSFVFDASCNVAWGLYLPKGVHTCHVPALCCFSWPSCERKIQKSIPISANVENTWYCTFFEHAIGFVIYTHKTETDIIGYLSTGYAMHLHVKDVERYGIVNIQPIYESKHPAIMCVDSTSYGGHTLFTVDSSAVIKKSDGTVIPWRKIAEIDWDVEMGTREG